MGETAVSANDQDTKGRIPGGASCLAVGDLGGEKPGEHTAIGQADCPRRGGGSNWGLRTAGVVEVRRDRRGDVSVMTVGTPVKAPQNTTWKWGAPGQFRRLE